MKIKYDDWGNCRSCEHSCPRQVSGGWRPPHGGGRPVEAPEVLGREDFSFLHLFCSVGSYNINGTDAEVYKQWKLIPHGSGGWDM